MNFILLSLAGCGEKQSAGKKFAPQEKISSLSDSERQVAIAERKASLRVDIPSMMDFNGVKLTVLPPKPEGNITEAISEQIGAKLLTIIAANGIGGVNNVPDFALGATMHETGKEMTATAPQKTIIKYTINYKVLNMLDGAVYSSTDESVTGVGATDIEATRNAVNEIKSTDNIQQMLATAKERIINWYEENLLTLKNQVSGAVNSKDYALALAYLNSVPSQAASAYAYASEEYPKVLVEYQKNIAHTELAALKGAIAKGEKASELNPEVYTHLAMLPPDSPQFKEASELVDKYQTSVLERQAKEKDQEFNVAEAKRIHEEQMQMAQLEADRQIAIAQAKASEQAMKQSMREADDSRRGFWGNLGARIISSMDYVGGKVKQHAGDLEE
ncbi:MAG: hypothetical protein J1E95_09965 [Muribaculaceae bacterium]|nr:hypothetical protein [Muribaculaceae bacterium]